MEKVLAENVKRICKAQNRQLKELASDMGIDPASLTRAIYGNARLDTIEKIAMALGVSVKSLFEPMGDEAVEGYIKIGGKISCKRRSCSPMDLVSPSSFASSYSASP